jgi:hypothetical protein
VISGIALVRGGTGLRLRDKLGEEQGLPGLKSVQACGCWWRPPAL